MEKRLTSASSVTSVVNLLFFFPPSLRASSVAGGKSCLWPMGVTMCGPVD